ncbi:MAG: glycosyltransferase family 8 protein [Armatimonadaceae bacterium]
MNDVSSEQPQVDEPLILVCGGDNNFAMPLAVMLYSALANLRPDIPVHLYVLDNGIKEESKEEINRVLRQSSLPPRRLDIYYCLADMSAYRDLKTGDWLNVSTYLRLTMPQLLPVSCNRALYIDGDMIVERDLWELWQMPLNDWDILAVRDYGIGYAAAPMGILPYKELNLEPETPYFNAGIMVVSLNKWRNKKIVPAAFDYMVRYQDIISQADQEALNAVVAGNWGEVDLRWNVQIGAVQAFHTIPDSSHKQAMQPVVEALIHEAYVLHYIGGRKPWFAGLTNPTRARFDHYLRRSRWFPSLKQYQRYRMRWLANNLRLIARDLRKK